MSCECKNYDFSEIESFWQKKWETEKTFEVSENPEKRKYYILDMFPYPSGAGLHIGHPEGYTASDIVARYHRAIGDNVLHPMGWDAFGLPAEQHAIKTGINPRENTAKNIQSFKKQIQSLGFSIDWSREINTTDPAYYRWTQWIFLQFFKHGLAYVDERPVWWCEGLKSVLANEEVVDGRSERGHFEVVRKNLRQWVLKITAYADKLLEGLPSIDWPDSTKRQQMAWIGKSEGANVLFPVQGHPLHIEIYTTRPDTLFGVTYLALAPEHPALAAIVTPEHQKEVEQYIAESKKKSDMERSALAKTKSGVFTGSYAINPVNQQPVAIWVADYVLPNSGTGAVMAVPAHDERDYAFAQKYHLPIIQVISCPQGETTLPFVDPGVLVQSGEFSGQPSVQAKKNIIQKLVHDHTGKPACNYKLRDWLFSRQRYWGEPIPIIWVKEADFRTAVSHEHFYFSEFLPHHPVSFEKEGDTYYAIPLTSKELPLTLPETDNYLPSSDGESPLSHIHSWVNVKINYVTGEILPVDAQTHGDHWIVGRRETNTMPQWAGSCWYYLRFMSPHDQQNLVNAQAEAYWKSPDFYIGGAEHAVLHLLYARFWHHFLYDIGVLRATQEPFQKLFHQGIILGEDGSKMSKSRGNVVNPDDIVREYGADCLRLYEMFLGPLDMMKPWNTSGIEGVSRFLKKVWKEFVDTNGNLSLSTTTLSPEAQSALHETIKKVTIDIEELKFNTAISQLMICLSAIQKAGGFDRSSAEDFIRLLAPFAPHIAEEIWARLGHTTSISYAGWPQYNEAFLIKDTVKIMVQVNGKVRAELVVSRDLPQEDIIQQALHEENVQKFTKDKTVAKTIYVPGKILNIVVK